MTTRYIPITPLNIHSEIRIDTHGNEASVTVYNCDIKHLDLLIMQLEALKAEYAPKTNPLMTVSKEELFPELQPLALGPKDPFEKVINIIAFDVPSAKVIRDYEDTHVHPMNLGAASLIDADEPPQMTAILGQKPDPTQWYKNALAKVAAQPEQKHNLPLSETLPDPEMPKPRKGLHTINIIGVETKKRKNYGGDKKVNENADIIKNESIRIYGISDNMHKWNKETQKSTYYKVAYDRTFKLGDVVEYDSYNFAYTGKIVAIGEKTVKVEHSHGGKITQLDLHEFILRNWDLDLAKIAEDRANWYD